MRLNKIKFLSMTVLLLLVITQNIEANVLTTPRGTSVDHDHPSDSDWNGHSANYWTTWSDDYYDGIYIERLDRANKAYNCHAYAWANARQSNSSSWCWIGNDPSCTDENVYWTDGSYNEVSYSSSTHISYGDTKDHSVLKYSGNVVTSKWGKLPRYKHNLYSDPYDASSSDASFYKIAVSASVYQTTNNVGSGRMNDPFFGSFTVTNTGGVQLNLTIQAPHK